MPEIFNDPEFERYRILEIDEGVSVLMEMIHSINQIGSGVNTDQFKGAIDMLYRIINLPIKMVPKDNESQKEQAKMLKSKAFAVFEIKMMRRFLGEE